MVFSPLSFLGNVSPDKSGLSVVSYDNIFKHLGEMPDSYIIFYSKQGLLACYLLNNQQLSTDSTPFSIAHKINAAFLV